MDLLLAERIVIFFDGDAFHDPESDHEVWSRLASVGYAVLSFTFDQVTRRPRYVVDQANATLETCVEFMDTKHPSNAGAFPKV